jgi:hypothetical protein
MLCLVYNVHNPLNYDVAFPSLLIDEKPTSGAIVHRVSSYSIYDKETHEFSDPKPVNIYKLRLSGLIKRKSETTRQDILLDGQTKHKLIQWNNRTGGVFFIRINGLDKYGRIEGELFDPVSGQSLTDWLIASYPQIYRRYA